ncbi:MAG: hypothetical protein ACOC0H_03085 [Thermodesulfobacteriota bacterium]
MDSTKPAYPIYFISKERTENMHEPTSVLDPEMIKEVLDVMIDLQ